MDFDFRITLFVMTLSSAFIEMSLIKEAWVRTITTKMTETNTPDDVYMEIITDKEMFSLNLKRYSRSKRRIPLFIDGGSTLERRDMEMLQSGIGVYWTKNGSFALKFKNGKISSCRGFFHTQHYVYTLQPGKEMLRSHTILRQPYHAFTMPEQEHKTGGKEVLPLASLHAEKHGSRAKRQTRLYEIELFVVVDYSLFLLLTSTQGTKVNRTFEEALEDIVQQFAVIVHGVDARFKTIKGSGYMIDVKFVGIYIAQTVSSSSWSEGVKEQTSTGAVVNEKSVNLFIEWMKSYQHDFPEFDHAMAFTAYNLRKEDNHKTLGLGYTQSLCTDRRFSIVEHHGDLAYVSYIATHELAHSLGAKHDGYPATVVYGDREETCSVDDGYIMCPKASRRPDSFARKWKFSDCTLLYFDFFIDHLNKNKTNCMTRGSSEFGLEGSALDVEDGVRVYTPDEQCERRHGEGYVLDRKTIGENISSICHRIPCINPSGEETSKVTLPLEGTVCGRQRICHLGRCVDNKNTYKNEGHLTEDNCVFEDQPGTIAGTGQNCQQLLGARHLAYKCYTYERQCCHACAQHRRQFTAIESCSYGDKKESCSAADCNTGLCCETCAVIAGKLRECPVLSAPDQGNVIFNTIRIHYGTVASFSCFNGYQLTGNKTANCLENGLWDSASPKCIKGCVVPQTYTHILFENVKSSYVEFGYMIRIKCKNGFTLVGDDTVECKAGKVLDDFVEKCTLGITSPAKIHISENIQPGSIVHHISTGNASSIFRLVYFSHPGFKVTQDGRVVVNEISEIDFEDVQSYTLVIEAKSKQDSRFKAKQRLIIDVDDLNEFQPKFLHEKYCISLQRPFIQDHYVFTVFASDRDGSGTNVSYVIQNSDLFRIDSLTGIITVSNAGFLNDSGNRVYMLDIEATDSGRPKLTSTCVVQVNCEKDCEQNGATAASCSSFKQYATIILYTTVIYSLHTLKLFLTRSSIR